MTTQVQTVLVCPAELDQAPPLQPTPAADATVATNASGGDYLAGLIVWGQGLAKQLSDAATACHVQAGAAAAPATAVQP